MQSGDRVDAEVLRNIRDLPLLQWAVERAIEPLVSFRDTLLTTRSFPEQCKKVDRC
jgi:hypothetical protein